MSQTDRQTDKATHWKSAIFEEEWPALNGELPQHVKELHKKLEICPTSGRQHYQVHVVCYRQVRLSAMTSWIRKTKWFAVIGEQHIKNSIAYISKVETTAPGAQVEVVKGQPYLQLHDLLLVVARNFSTYNEDEKPTPNMLLNQHMWERALRLTIQEMGIHWISKLSNPVLSKMWNICWRELLDAVQKEEGSFIIEEPDNRVLGYAFIADA